MSADFSHPDTKNQTDFKNESEELSNEKVSAKAFRDSQLDSILSDIRNECMEQKITPEECAKLFQQRAELYVNE